jgi:glycosyltransferase involved in cell wall biosynthesis
MVYAVKTPNIACLCPTFKRPDCLRNVVRCFQEQDYPELSRRLFIVDDAAQFDSQQIGKNVHLMSLPNPIATLASKFHFIADWAQAIWDVDVFANWEDDDIYLPNHLQMIGNVLKDYESPDAHFLVPEQVYSNYAMPKGYVRRENALGRFHGAWAFERKALIRSGGWPRTEDIAFDQQFLKRLKETCTEHVYVGDPTYVYRWGNATYHGSSYKGDFTKKVHALNLPAEHIGKLEPAFDDETQAAINRYRNSIGAME